MRKNFVKRIAYVSLAVLLAGTVSGCGKAASGQAQNLEEAGNGEVNSGGVYSGIVSGHLGEGDAGSSAGGESSGDATGMSGNGDDGTAVGTSGIGGAENAKGTTEKGGVGNTDTAGNSNVGNDAGMTGDVDAGTAVGKVGNGDNKNSSGTTGNGDANTGTAADGAEAVTDFGLRLLQGCAGARAAFPPYASMPEDVYAKTGKGKNILVSPLSVISALAMTANGAGGETLTQMEAAFGMPVPELSIYLSDYRESLPEADKYKLSMANGIWFTEDERFTVEQAFLQTNEDFFGAGVYRAPFDASTLREINGWVKEKTDGMIEKILDFIPPDAVMYLVNALAFDAEWQEVYHKYQVRQGEFTQEDGNIQSVEMMYSTENAYLEDEHAEGFLKYYAEGKYAFAALLPEEGMTIFDYLSSLDGAKLREILENPSRVQVDAAIPKYESEYSIEMQDVLQSLGMTDAFEQSKADFSGIGYSTAGNLYISRVLHKTFIAVDEKGTKAGAATAVEIRDECTAIVEPIVKTVHLDRPFLYMIIDCEAKVPVFIGMVETVE